MHKQDVSKTATPKPNRRIQTIEIIFSAGPFMPDYHVYLTSGTGHVRELVLPAARFGRLMRSTVMRSSVGRGWKQTDVRFTPSDGWCFVTYERYGDAKNA